MRCPRCRSENPDGAAVCAKCGALFKTEGQPPGPPTETFAPPVRDLAPGAVIAGRYRLIERLGEGGMGTVFLAEQTSPVQRSVAVKIIKLGMDTKEVVARFESERQALAVMNHPHIARVFDGGATERGRPYFVMELVRGVPITDYCDKHRLSTRERLELMIPVCQAVQHAHQKGVIHRDLKPSNILVTIQDGRPVPKIIDFGIAKATDHRLTQRTLFTEQGKLIGTPEYMSPEQAEMSGLDVDTRTDVYSLGVMLYELLTGALPFDRKTLRSAGYGEIQRIIRETDPPRASTRFSGLGEAKTAVADRRRTDPPSLSKQLRGDLDWIILKAMEKDRTRR
ncbi:MAG: serine/threonine protein kinase, partial [Candidatus Aminicenantes bacterium]|nr:serine/threonine protein kinase [Candidatus Aminicenantes bacterium]